MLAEPADLSLAGKECVASFVQSFQAGERGVSQGALEMILRKSLADLRTFGGILGVVFRKDPTGRTL